jgi:NAD(P)-dependent dehydrogenase (short-subunit alcohol dehydrogenase family)
MRRFEGKTAVVTGAGSGFGLHLTRRLVEEGARVYALDIRNQDKAIEGLGATASASHCDVTKPDEVAAFFDDLDRASVRIDMVFNNAGIGRGGKRLHEVPTTDFDAVLDVNLRGAFFVMKHALASMLKSGGGAIVNTASTSSFKAMPALGSYGASKAALENLTKQASIEYAKDNIRINCVCPGLSDTGIIQHLSEAEQIAVRDLVPTGRVAHPNEVVNVMLFLASDEASFVTGSAYVADGGLLAT